MLDKFKDNEIYTENSITYGILYKKPINRYSRNAQSAAWKKRYIVFKRGFIFYYKEKPTASTVHHPTGVIDVEDAKFYTNATEKRVIDIIPKVQDIPVINYKASSEELATKWLFAFAAGSKPTVCVQEDAALKQRTEDVENYYKNMIEQYKEIIQNLSKPKP